MSEPQQVQNSTGSIRSSEQIEDTFRRMNVNAESMEQSSPYPYRPGEKDCQFFLRTGRCGYGNDCRYNHPLPHLPQTFFYHRDGLPERIGQPDCDYFLRTGTCKYGPSCKYHHPKDRNGAGPVLFNVLGYPMREGKESCKFYMQKGCCKFGVVCKFHHPHPENDNDFTTTYGFPSVAFPYTGGMPMMSLPPPTYGVMPPPPTYEAMPPPPTYEAMPPPPTYEAMPPPATYEAMPPPATYGAMPPPATYGAMPFPQVPHPQAYMPYMFAPPQDWSTYIASSSASVPYEGAECRFFMRTGTCKYGDNCKYFHPKEWMLPSPPPPSRFDSTAVSNGNKPAAESHSSETETQADRSDKSEMQDSSQLSISDSTALSIGKSDAENPSSETKKHDDNSSQPDSSGKQDSSHSA